MGLRIASRRRVRRAGADTVLAPLRRVRRGSAHAVAALLWLMALAFAIPSVLAAVPAPESPRDATFTAGDGLVMIEWDRWGMTREADYHLFFQFRYAAGSSVPDDTPWLLAVPFGSAPNTHRIVTGLTNGTAYTFELRTLPMAGIGNLLEGTAPALDRKPVNRVTTPRATTSVTAVNAAITRISYLHHLLDDAYDTPARWPGDRDAARRRR